ncbi:MAG TPA: ECF-type sigma factor [Gemmataceae bacterium]|jgi:DNA-directed RNA polymerase specialized sigma24 family protein|nr:ECF-type sigma factor [Gemmataceae bacterium]
MSSAKGSVTHWLGRLKAGDHAAAQELWERYFRRLVGLAGQILPQHARKAADEEDAALSAFASFCRCAQLGRFPQLLDRDDLWQLLVVLTARKARHQVTYEQAQKRGGGKHTETPPPGADAEDSALDQILSREPTPAFAAQVAEEYQRLLDGLGDDQLRAVAVWKMEGYTNEEIAQKLGRTPRSVERKLQLIRRKLQRLNEEEGER